MKKERLRKGQVVSFRPNRNLLRRDADILKVYNGKRGNYVELSLYASPSEVSIRRSFMHAWKKVS